LKSSISRINEQRKQLLQLFTKNSSRVFYGLEPEFFQQKFSKIIDDVISKCHGSLKIWSTLVEICYFYKDKKDLPQIRVKNKKIKSKNGAKLSGIQS
jgi:hypothetical protein